MSLDSTFHRLGRCGTTITWMLSTLLLVACTGMQPPPPPPSCMGPLAGDWMVDSFEKDDALSHNDPSMHHLSPGAEFSLIWDQNHYFVAKRNSLLWPEKAWSNVQFGVLEGATLAYVNAYLLSLGRQSLGPCSNDSCAYGELVIDVNGTKDSAERKAHHSATVASKTHVVVLSEVSNVRTLNPCDLNASDGRCLRIELFCVPITDYVCGGGIATLQNGVPPPPPPPDSGEPIHGGLGHSHGQT